eukprot:194462-Rhodomonas_salina.3
MRFVSGRSMQLEARVAVLEGEKRELRARLEAMEEERERMELVLDEAARDIARRERQQLEQEEAWVGARVAEATAKVVALEERLRDSDEEKLRCAAISNNKWMRPVLTWRVLVPGERQRPRG